MILKAVALATSLLLVTVPYEEPPKQTGYIYLGDSRFVGMERACNVSDDNNTWVVAKVGQGLKWCESTAMSEIEEIVSSNPQISDWVLISGLGVNDTYNADEYVEFYDTLDGFTLVLCSVNPVEKDKCEKYGYDYPYLNRGVTKVNAVLQDTDYPYIDTNSYLLENGYSTVDGVHYTPETYGDIYVYIQQSLEDIGL